MHNVNAKPTQNTPFNLAQHKQGMKMSKETEGLVHVVAVDVEDLLRLVQKMGGSMEYCHGVGIKLAPLMAEEHGYGLEVMRRIKKAVDPNDIMNPGKLGL